ncbi:hypothetical protein [Halorubrum sp. SD690R]|uniref:hypothetical protein n=1 Tax=Halorubrum sp. SD690R TaxID=2518117 RepID=UPI00130515FB|nr:hypothetical protein [Halorubrum sp. SD690R]
MQNTIEAEHLREAYDENELPKTGTVRNSQYEAANDETEISFNVGDVIERQNTVGENTAVEFRYVLELYEHGVVVWVLDDERYTYYPRNYLREDLTEYEVRVHDDPWGIREADE